MTMVLQRLYNEQRQSAWMDNITRGSIRSGTLRKLIDEGIRGLTANPTIFQKAVSGSADYDESVRELARRGMPSAEIYERLIVEDIQDAADVLRPLYDETAGVMATLR